jgi:hypothetical protein
MIQKAPAETFFCGGFYLRDWQSDFDTGRYRRMRACC